MLAQKSECVSVVLRERDKGTCVLPLIGGRWEFSAQRWQCLCSYLFVCVYIYTVCLHTYIHSLSFWTSIRLFMAPFLSLSAFIHFSWGQSFSSYEDNLCP